MARAKIKELTPKEEMFCQIYSSGTKKAAAFEQAGYSFRSLKGRNEAACKLSKKPHIKARLKEIKDALAEKFDYTREQAATDLKEIQDIARGGLVTLPDGTTLEGQPTNPAAMSKAVGQMIDLFGIEPAKKVDVNFVDSMQFIVENEK